MGAGHVSELGNAILDPTSGSVQVEGPSMLTQGEEGGPGLLAAEALVPALLRVRVGTRARLGC